MWRILLLVFLALRGVECTLSEEDELPSSESSNSAPCDYVGLAHSSCIKIHGVSLGVDWSEEDLDQSCRSFLKYADCVEDHVKNCLGGRAADIANSQSGVNRDLCDEDSNLRTVYLRNSMCLNGLKSYYPYGRCMTSGGILYELYTNGSRIQVHVDGYERKPCFQSAYATACRIATAKRRCGEDAGALLTEIAQRMKGVEVACPEQYREEIKNEFYNFLKEMQDNLEADHSILPGDVGIIFAVDEPKSPRMEKAFFSL